MGYRIWIVNAQTGSPEKVANPRYLELAKYFMGAGHEVTTFNSSQREGIAVPDGKCLVRYYGDYKFVHVHAPNFSGNTLKRMLSLHKFSKNVYALRNRFERPDVILHNIHPPFDYPIVRLAKRLGCHYIAEAWDLWPESFVRFGLIGEGNPAMKIAHAIEKRYYYAADEIVFTLKGAADYLKQRGWTTDAGGKIDPSHIHYINNGIDLKQFALNRDAHPREDSDLNDERLFKIVYLGSISHANHVKTLVDAAARLKDDPRYKFIIYGDGTYRTELEHYAIENHIDNVVFKEKRIPLAECAWVVSQATINIMNYEKGFGKWGTSSGKMFQYLAAGRPIVCNRIIGYDNVINESQLGVSREMETPEEFATEIRRIAELPKEEYNAMCDRVRATAKRFDYNTLAAQELKIIESALSPSLPSHSNHSRNFRGMYTLFLKRSIGFLGSLVAILLLSPLLIAVTLWLHMANKGAGAFFFQTRIGKDEKPFKIMKFKSMTDERDTKGELLPDAQRLTRAGRFVRSTSIDELPQLFNILKGDMAFIGPRPLPPSYLPYYTDDEAHRHDVRPGISGWAQVNGRKNISWQHKLECDRYYVQHLTLWLDLKIFFMTVVNVFKREGVGVESSGVLSLYDTRDVQRPQYMQK